MNIEEVKKDAVLLRYEMNRHDNIDIDNECLTIDEIFEMWRVLISKILDENVITDK